MTWTGCAFLLLYDVGARGGDKGESEGREMGNADLKAEKVVLCGCV